MEKEGGGRTVALGELYRDELRGEFLRVLWIGDRWCSVEQGPAQLPFVPFAPQKETLLLQTSLAKFARVQGT